MSVAATIVPPAERPAKEARRRADPADRDAEQDLARRRHVEGHASPGAWGRPARLSREEIAQALAEQAARRAARASVPAAPPAPAPHFEMSVDYGQSWDPCTAGDMRWFLEHSGQQGNEDDLAVVRQSGCKLAKFGWFRWVDCPAAG